MIVILVLLAIIASTIIVLWYLSERAHARAETTAMRQLKAAIKYLKKRNNG
jgi:flagellar basal body-associated protein FliL